MELFRKIKERSRKYYRFVIMDNATFEEKVVFRLKPLSIFVAVIIAVLVLVIGCISLIAFTFLREYIPGYGSTKQTQRITELQITVDSLNRVMSGIEIYGRDIKTVLLGEDFVQDTLSVSNIEKKEAVFSVTNYDSLLMQITEHYSPPSQENAQFHFLKPQRREMSISFFPPVNEGSGQRYVKSNRGVEIKCKEGTSIHASATGTVVHIGYDPQNGTSLMMHYPNNVLMIYRQIGTPLVSVGDIVKTKQVIAITDFDQIVYFELWIDGIAVELENYMLF
ncbi:MAG: M23 family metallopeptidase [Bacteroidales bacterium]|nr:M23 family metallopeptidase [Bacteroidales bacterium]